MIFEPKNRTLSVKFRIKILYGGPLANPTLHPWLPVWNAGWRTSSSAGPDLGRPTSPCPPPDSVTFNNGYNYKLFIEDIILWGITSVIRQRLALNLDHAWQYVRDPNLRESSPNFMSILEIS